MYEIDPSDPRSQSAILRCQAHNCIWRQMIGRYARASARWGEALFPQLKPIEFLNQRAPSSRVQTSEVPAEFAAALADVGAVGMTFGGCFAGHGIYVADGNATFILDSYSVQ